MEVVPPVGTGAYHSTQKTGKAAALLIELLVHMIIVKIGLTGGGLTTSVISIQTSCLLTLCAYSLCVSVSVCISVWLSDLYFH